MRPHRQAFAYAGSTSHARNRDNPPSDTGIGASLRHALRVSDLRLRQRSARSCWSIGRTGGPLSWGSMAWSNGRLTGYSSENSSAFKSDCCAVPLAARIAIIWAESSIHKRTRRLETFVTLQTNEIAAKRLRQDLGNFCFATTGFAH